MQMILKYSPVERSISVRTANARVITQWQEKKRTVIVHTYLKEKIPVGLIPYAQSTLLAKYIRGEIDEYPCFLMK